MTKLSRYIQNHGITQASFASKTGLNQSTISRLCEGTISATVETALKVERATNGEVRFSDLIRQTKQALVAP